MREELHVDDVLKVTYSEVLRLTWGPENSTLTVTNNPSDGECDLQYVIYVQFFPVRYARGIARR
jgi:hypothetical protein